MRPPPEIIEVPIRIKTTTTQFNRIASSFYGPRLGINTTFTSQRDIDITEVILSEEPVGTNLDRAVFGEFYEIGRLRFNRSDIQARIDNPSVFHNDAPLLYLEVRFQLNSFLRINTNDGFGIGAGYLLSMNGGGQMFNFADYLEGVSRIDSFPQQQYGGPRKLAISVGVVGTLTF